MGLTLKKIWDLLIFFVFNVVLSFADNITDGYTAATLWESHPMWAIQTIFWMMAPFLVELTLFFLQKCNEKGFKAAFKHLPLVMPLVNTRHLYMLNKVKYADPMDSADQIRIEEIRMEAGEPALTEGFMESGPQLLLQIHIILCRGDITNTQIITITVSLISLTVAACRGFFMKRDAKRADPEPSPHMMLRVLPYMMMVLLSNVSSWTFIIGILKGWTFLVLFLIFLSSYLVHKGWDFKKGRHGIIDTAILEADSKQIELLKQKDILIDTVDVDVVVGDGEALEEKEKQCFSVQAALISLWIPAIVGKRTYTLTLTTITSTTLRTLAFILSCILAILNLVPANPFLLYCAPLTTNPATQSLTLCFNITHCFQGSSLNELRVCDQTFQDPVFIFSASFVFAALVFSLVGSFFLHKLSDYEYMFEYSRHFFWFLECPIFPCCLTSILSPIIHRSLVFTYIENNQDDKAAEKLKRVFEVSCENQNIASRQLMGKTPMDNCVENNKPNSAQVLLDNRAQIEEKNLTLSVVKEQKDMVNVFLKNEAKFPENKAKFCAEHLTTAVENMDLSITKLLLDHGLKVKAEHLTLSLETKDPNMTNLVIAHGGSVAAECLMKSVENKDHSMTNLLLAHGVNIEGKHLTKSMKNKDHSMTNLLLVNGVHHGKRHFRIAANNADVNMMKLLASHTFNFGYGPNHELINTGSIISVLENQEMTEERKEKIVKSLQKLGVTVDEDNLTNNTRKKVEKVLKDWNKAHPEEVVEIKKRKVRNLVYEINSLKTAENITSDKNVSMEGEKSITGIECRLYVGRYIQNLRVKYGDKWGEWHDTGYKYDDDGGRSSVFTLEEGENIIRVHTESNSSDGWLCYLEVVTSTGRNWKQKARNGDTNLDCEAGTLAYVSSSGFGHGVCQYAFHWK